MNNDPHHISFFPLHMFPTMEWTNESITPQKNYSSESTLALLLLPPFPTNFPKPNSLSLTIERLSLSLLSLSLSLSLSNSTVDAGCDSWRKCTAFIRRCRISRRRTSSCRPITTPWWWSIPPSRILTGYPYSDPIMNSSPPSLTPPAPSLRRMIRTPRPLLSRLRSPLILAILASSNPI